MLLLIHLFIYFTFVHASWGEREREGERRKERGKGSKKV